jgi:hypothetical protein
MATGLQFTLEGKAYDIDDFSLGDLEWLEDHIGMPLSDERALSSMKTMVGFVYLVKKRDDPGFTLDQAREVKLSVLDADDNAGGDGAKPKRPTKAARSS